MIYTFRQWQHVTLDFIFLVTASKTVPLLETGLLLIIQVRKPSELSELLRGINEPLSHPWDLQNYAL